MPCAFPQGKAATHVGSISQLDFKNIGKDDLGICRSLLVWQPIGNDSVGLASIHITLLASLEQHGSLAMPHGIILLMPLFNRGGDRFIFLCLFAFKIERSSCHAQGSRHLAFRIGAVRPTQLVGQFHLLCGLYFLNSPEAFFKISFWTVSSPITFFKSSGDSPGS